MEGKQYSISRSKSTKKGRLGCSVCLKKNTNDSLIVNSSSNDRKHLENNITNTKNKKYENNKTPTILLPRPLTDECYCNYMEQIKTKSFPKLICSKYFEIPNCIDIDADWLHEIIEFRRENWFDCHSNSLNDSICIQNNNYFLSDILNLQTQNKNHLNDSILSNSTSINEFKKGNSCMDIGSSAEIVKHINVKEKTMGQKPSTKKKKTPKTVFKPWIPPSVHF